MLIEKCTPWMAGAWLCMTATLAAGQDVGSIRGIVHDKDFDTTLSGVEVLNLATEQKVTTGDQGNYVFREVAPGTYTLVFSREGYVRQVRADVVVQAGQLTEVEVWMPGDFTDMEEFVVEEGVGLGSGSEAALLELRLEPLAAGLDLGGPDEQGRRERRGRRAASRRGRDRQGRQHGRHPGPPGPLRGLAAQRRAAALGG